MENWRIGDRRGIVWLLQLLCRRICELRNDAFCTICTQFNQPLSKTNTCRPNLVNLGWKIIDRCNSCRRADGAVRKLKKPTTGNIFVYTARRTNRHFEINRTHYDETRSRALRKSKPPLGISHEHKHSWPRRKISSSCGEHCTRNRLFNVGCDFSVR